jgi:FKBP-type peptidyl-prolyl cis-trans isomerase
MFRLFQKREKKPTPAWISWLVIAFIIYAMVISKSSKQEVPAKPPAQAPAVSQNETVHNENAAEAEISSLIQPEKILNISDIDILKDRLLPQKSLKLTVKDTLSGEGPFSMCGQNVTINYRAFTLDEKEIENVEGLTFKLGEGKVMPALEQGVMGMKKNGKRVITSPGSLAYGTEKFARSDVPGMANIRFEVEMRDISPPSPEVGIYRILGDSGTSSNTYGCGSVAKLNMSIWDIDGKKLYDSKDNNGAPINFTIGKSEVFFGLEQGALGMEAGTHRNLIVPPNFQKTLSGDAPLINFNLPKNHIVLVDIEAVP